MAQLSSGDLRAALDFVGEAHGFEDVEAFRHGILPGLQRLVPSDLVGYNEVDPGGEALVLTYPFQVPDQINAELARLAHQHPLISVQINGDNDTYKISDFLSARQFRRLELYDSLYSQIGAEDQIAFGLSGPVVIGIAMNRDRRSFGERDRDMLDLLRPHLAQLTGAALALLDRYFPERRGAALPTEVVAWLEASNRPAALSVETAAGRLTISAQPSTGSTIPLVLEEAPAITPERLAPLGLTRRQAEVLVLLADGAGVERIADQLYISRATVRKHLEHVYARLGVHSRAEAIERARAPESALDHRDGGSGRTRVQ